jgi:hypothetical protein
MARNALCAQPGRTDRFPNAALDTTIGSTDPDIQALKHAEIQHRYKAKAKRKGAWSWHRWCVRRFNEIELALWDRYPSGVLPDDKYGHDSLRVVLFHLAQCRNALTMRMWIGKHAAWALADARRLIDNAFATQAKPPKADTLAWRINLTAPVRDRLGIRTIGAVDMPKRERTKRRKDRKRLADAVRASAKRKAAGATPRAESASQTKPWTAAGFGCRRTWERHGKPAPEAGVANSSPHKVAKLPAKRRTCVTAPAAPPIDIILPPIFHLAAPPRDALPVVALPLGISALGHPLLQRWLDGEVVTVALNDSTVCSVQAAWCARARDHRSMVARVASWPT